MIKSELGKMEMAQKPKPTAPLPAGHEYQLCNKCGGNGLYIMEVRNGRPWSSTGIQCWKCGGVGWAIKKPRRRRCPVCNMLVTPVDGVIPPHTYNYIRKGANCAELIECQGESND